MTFVPPEIPGVAWHIAAPLAPRTTYKVGGAADILADIADVAGLTSILRALSEANMPFVVLGNGSNLLVSDDGYRGCALVLGEAFKTLDITTDDDGTRHLVAGAAVSITRLLRFAKQSDFSGLHRLGGVPGTVGGAVKMNAGTRWGETADILHSATICTAAGQSDRPTSALGLAYRHSEILATEVVTAATFVLPAEATDTVSDYEEVLAYRKRTQPLQYPSCGSVFANPPGDSAGRLIEAAGLKGMIIGGASISDQHANWIINLGDATAADVYSLITLARTRVEAEFGVVLRPEVQLIGSFPRSSTDSAGGPA